jgi:hypothetical protein
MKIAFKEWVIIVDALARGDQIFILRKGGIHEGRGGFHPEHSEFLLFPTLFHQQRDSVIEPAQSRFDQIAPFFPDPNVLRLEFWAQLVEWHHIDRFEVLQRLRGQHIWKEQVLADRFEWGGERAIFALVLRILRLPVAIEVPMLPEYGGCKSWVQIARIPTQGSAPVLSEPEFRGRLNRFRAALSQDAQEKGI